MTTKLLHGEVTDKILRVYYEVLNELGFGFTEDVFQAAMVIALTSAGLQVRQKVPLRIWFRGERIATFFPDIIVNDVVLLELKTGSVIEPRHEAQVLNYLRASDLEVGLILLFGPQAKSKRLLYTADRKRRAVEGIPLV
jgi:GxxExxY protein